MLQTIKCLFSLINEPYVFNILSYKVWMTVQRSYSTKISDHRGISEHPTFTLTFKCKVALEMELYNGLVTEVIKIEHQCRCIEVRVRRCRKKKSLINWTDLSTWLNYKRKTSQTYGTSCGVLLQVRWSHWSCCKHCKHDY